MAWGATINARGEISEKDARRLAKTDPHVAALLRQHVAGQKRAAKGGA